MGEVAEMERCDFVVDGVANVAQDASADRHERSRGKKSRERFEQSHHDEIYA